jgi:hypothetical protein
MLAAQMTAVHNAVMTFTRRLAHVDNIRQQDSAQNALNKLARTFAAQVAALKNYRLKGEQRVVVQHQHVNVNDGGQAIVGAVMAGPGGAEKTEDQPHALGYAVSPEMHGDFEKEPALCRAPAVRGHSVCRMHGAGGGAPIGNQNSLKHGAFSADAIEAARRRLRSGSLSAPR